MPPRNVEEAVQRVEQAYRETGWMIVGWTAMLVILFTVAIFMELR